MPAPEDRVIPDAVPQELDKPKLLIGEGKDEILIFGALLNHLGIDDVKVEDFGGKHKLPDYLDTLQLRPGFHDLRSLGVTRDADSDAMSAFTSVRDHLTARNLVSPVSSGNIAEGTPRIGVVILPDGQQQGMLEDLCLTAFQTDPVIDCLEKYFECIKEAKGKLPSRYPKHESMLGLPRKSRRICVWGLPLKRD